MIACLVLAPLVATAGPEKPRRLEMKRGHERVISFEDCGDPKQDVATVVVDLRRGRKLAVVATGKQVESHASTWETRLGCELETECFATHESVTWTTRWTGRWSIARDTLTLDLVLANDTCKLVEDPPQVQPSLSCKAASKQTRVTCTRSVGERSEWRCDGRGLGQSQAWVLSPPVE